MKRFLKIVFTAFCCYSFLSTTLFASANPPFSIYLPMVDKSPSLIVWTVDPATKIQPTTYRGTGNLIPLEGARGAYESYQLIVTAEAALSGVNVTASALSDGAGHTIPAANLVFFREAFIDYTGVVENEPGNAPAPKFSATNDPRVPDPLIPFIDPYTL